jgi:hypothetical protein
MLTDPMLSFAGKVVTSLGKMVATGRNQSFELKKENSRLEIETSSKRNDLIRERLKEIHTILFEISREFALDSLTNDASNRMSPNDFHNKYRDLCTKVDRMKLIAMFDIPALAESIKDLSLLMNHYWGNFHIVLMKEVRGEKVDHTTPSYSETVEYSRQITSKVYNIESKISKLLERSNHYSVM